MQNEKKDIITTPTTDPTLNELLGDTWLAETLGKEPDDVPVDTKLEPGEKIVGEMSPVERRIYAHSIKIDALSKMAKINAQYKHNDELMDEARILRHRARTLAKLMWSLIHDRVGYQGDGLGIRDSYKIVELVEGHGEPDLMQMIRDLIR